MAEKVDQEHCRGTVQVAVVGVAGDREEPSAGTVSVHATAGARAGFEESEAPRPDAPIEKRADPRICAEASPVEMVAGADLREDEDRHWRDDLARSDLPIHLLAIPYRLA